MSAEPTPGLTRVTVNLTPTSTASLSAAADRCGHTHTDTINRAVQLYNEITAAANADGGRLTVSDPDGVALVVTVAPNTTQPGKRRSLVVRVALKVLSRSRGLAEGR
jgi:hypothetical protein